MQVEASQKFLDTLKNDVDMSKSRINFDMLSRIERANTLNLSKEDHDAEDMVTLGRVMELDGFKRSMPMRRMLEKPYKAHLFAADAVGLMKRRLVDNSSLRSVFSSDEGILSSLVGSIHRPALIDLCGGREIQINALPTNKRGVVGQWKPIEMFYPAFRVGNFEELFTITPEYYETSMGSVFKYGFNIRLSDRNTLSDVTIDVASRWFDNVLMQLELQMLNDFYMNLVERGKREGAITTKDLGSRSRNGSAFNIDRHVWRSLHRSFGHNHGLTDVFCDETQEEIIHNLPLRNAATISVRESDSLIELRNRISDGTYVWSHFIQEPEEFVVPAIDRQSCAAFYYVTDSETREQQTSILTGAVDMTFSIIVGFDVIDTEGLKLVSIQQ